jgi:hypothetical protein
MTRERRLSLTTWILATGLILLGVYTYLVEVRGGERQERAQTAATRLLSFPADAATQLVIERPGERIVCRKERGQWRIVAPVQSSADEATVSRILTDVGESKVERTVAARAAEPVAFGLAHPLVLTVAAGPRRQSIEVGKENPTSSFVFARRLSSPGAPAASTPVLLADRRLRDAAETKLYDLREKTVLDFIPDEVKSITYSSESRQIRLVRQPAVAGETQAGWKLIEPFRARADRGQVERSLNLVSSLRAEQFVSEKPVGLARYGLDRPSGSARFDLKDGRSLALLIGRKTVEGALPRYFARQPGAGPIFTINDNLPRDAQQPPEEWRERHVTDFARADVKELRLISPTRTVVCAKKQDPNSNDWGVAEFAGRVAEGMNLAAAARMPAAQRADRDRVEELLAHLGTLDAKAFLDGATPGEPRFGLTPPNLKVVALNEAGKPVAAVSFGARVKDRCYAAGPHLDGVFMVTASDTSRFRVSARDLSARS